MKAKGGGILGSVGAMPSNDKAAAIVGGLIGLILFYAWIFFTQTIMFSFFGQREIVRGVEIVKVQAPVQIFSWLMIGLLPFFITGGHFLICTEKKAKSYDTKMMKSSFLGFAIWLIVITGAYFFKIGISYHENIAGGFITILIVWPLSKSKF